VAVTAKMMASATLAIDPRHQLFDSDEAPLIAVEAVAQPEVRALMTAAIVDEIVLLDPELSLARGLIVGKVLTLVRGCSPEPPTLIM
jgi:hypothetical protein